MKSFLLKDKKPILKWGQIPDEYYFEGEIPESYSLAICPHFPYVILDIDKHGNINGFDNIPMCIKKELLNHFGYATKNKGYHCWLKYTGEQKLMNKTSGLGLDLRTEKGYVQWYLDKDIRSYIDCVRKTSPLMNKWLEQLFTNKIREKIKTND